MISKKRLSAAYCASFEITRTLLMEPCHQRSKVVTSGQFRREFSLKIPPEIPPPKDILDERRDYIHFKRSPSNWSHVVRANAKAGRCFGRRYARRCGGNVNMPGNWSRRPRAKFESEWKKNRWSTIRRMDKMINCWSCIIWQFESHFTDKKTVAVSPIKVNRGISVDRCKVLISRHFDLLWLSMKSPLVRLGGRKLKSCRPDQ
jgi:hypothetical protein